VASLFYILTTDYESFIIDSKSVEGVMMTIRKRAMSEAQKLERRQAFLEAAQKLFQETSFNG
jgi:hypothetical protein